MRPIIPKCKSKLEDQLLLSQYVTLKIYKRHLIKKKLNLKILWGGATIMENKNKGKMMLNK